MNKVISIFLFLVFISTSLSFAQSESTSSIQGDNSTDTQTEYKPGFKLNGISLNDADFYDIPTEKCQGDTVATIIKPYFLTNKVFIFQTENGYGVADIALSFRDVETGVRRAAMKAKPSCKLAPGLKLAGGFDCRGSRMVKKAPYEGCAYDLKVWAHSISKEQAFEIVYKKLQEQFLDYRENCKLQPKTTLRDRMAF